jgi:hypothetical protein
VALNMTGTASTILFWNHTRRVMERKTVNDRSGIDDLLEADACSEVDLTLVYCSSGKCTHRRACHRGATQRWSGDRALVVARDLTTARVLRSEGVRNTLQSRDFFSTPGTVRGES